MVLIAIQVITGALLIGFWLWMIVDLANNDYLPPEEKNRWFIIFILMNIFGAVWYYRVEYRNRHL